MKVGFHSPLPPSPTGVADYSARLLAELRRFGKVEPDAAQADVHLYHVGNNQLHSRIYQQALSHPGVVVLHDAVLHHFLLGFLNPDSYVDEFVYNYGDWERAQARELWSRRAISGADPRYFQYPMLRRVASHARAVIVHNPGAAGMVRAHAPDVRIYRIPHLAMRPQAPDARESMRRRLGIPDKAFVFAVFGHLRESKRLIAVLRAFRRIRALYPQAALLVAGECVSRDLQRSLEYWLTLPGIHRIGHTEEADFWSLAGACDTCINLRYPPAGETSGISIRLMGIGKPVIMTESAETSEFPPDACVRVEHGPLEQRLLEAAMAWLVTNPVQAREIGRRAAAFVQSRHDPAAVAQLYWQALEENR